MILEILLTDRAKKCSAFVTPNGLYQYKVMPFGMKNSPATFQDLINMIINGLENWHLYRRCHHQQRYLGRTYENHPEIFQSTQQYTINNKLKQN